MKRIVSVFGATLCIICSCAQPDHNIVVPELVKAKFASINPSVNDPTWEMEDGRYEASYKQDHREMSMMITPDGIVHQTETELEVALLPQPVKDYVASQLGDKKIKEASKIVEADGSTSYEAEVGTADYLFDSSGQFIRKEENEKGEKSDND